MSHGIARFKQFSNDDFRGSVYLYSPIWPLLAVGYEHHERRPFRGGN